MRNSEFKKGKDIFYEKETPKICEKIYQKGEISNSERSFRFKRTKKIN